MNFTKDDLFRFGTVGVVAATVLIFSVAVGFTCGSLYITMKMLANEVIDNRMVVTLALNAAGTVFIFGFLMVMWMLLKVALIGSVLAPAPEPKVTPATIYMNEGRTMQLLDIPATRSQLREMGNRIILGGQNFTSDFVKVFDGDGDAFKKFRAWAVGKQYLFWRRNDPQGGLGITDEGTQFFAEWADEEQSIPSPTGGSIGYGEYVKLTHTHTEG